MAQVNDEVVFVDPNGVGVSKGEKLRFSLGNPFVEGSLFGDRPVLVPWSQEALASALVALQGVMDEEAALKVKRNIHEMREFKPSTRFLFASVHKGLFEPGWRYKGLSGGRASTKSVAVADYLLLQGHASLKRYLCVRQFFASIRTSVKETFGQRADELGLGEFYKAQGAELVGANGSLFPFKGMDRDPESVKSTQGLHGVWVEEAQTIMQGAFSRLLPTIRESKAELIFTFNRVDEDAPVDRFFYKERPDDALLIESTYMDNPWLGWAISREIERDRNRDPAYYRHVWSGHPESRPDAQVIRNWRIPRDEELKEIVGLIREDDEIVPMYGLDIGHSSPTAFIEAFVLPPVDDNSAMRLFIASECYKTGVEIEDLPSFLYGSDARRRWINRKGFKGIPGAQAYAVVADSANANVVSYLKGKGIRAHSAFKGPGTVERGLKAINSFDVLIHPRCENAIREARSYSYKVDPRTDKPTEKIEKGDDHCWDALRYAMNGFSRHLFPARKKVAWGGGRLDAGPGAQRRVYAKVFR